VSLEIQGVVLLHPTTFLTNLLLALEVWILALRVRPPGRLDQGSGDPLLSAASVRTDRRLWAGFFFSVGTAAFLGAFKHGFPHYLEGAPLSLTVSASNLAAGVGVFLAEVVTIRVRAAACALRPWLLRAAVGKLILFASLVFLSRSFLWVVADAAMGLVPVMGAELHASRKGDRGARWVFWGLCFSFLPAVVHLWEISVHSWFTSDDLAHVLLMFGLLLVYRGAAARLR
jgi:hypothetical protein